MTNWRQIARVLHPITSLTADEHAEIKRLARDYKLDWSTDGGDYGAKVAKFRAELKDHYHHHQRRRCCYCSSELIRHKATYDAEHILDKDNYPEYMFNEDNIAVACKLCNQYKSNKPVSSNGMRFAELSRRSDDYVIIHPHLDEWSHHLRFDSVGRIVSLGSKKGQETIRICGMTALNATRLADNFDIDDVPMAEEALRAFHEIADPSRRKRALELLTDLARNSDDAAVDAVIDALTMDLSPAATGETYAVLQGSEISPAVDHPILRSVASWKDQPAPHAMPATASALMLPPSADVSGAESPKSSLPLLPDPEQFE